MKTAVDRLWAEGNAENKTHHTPESAVTLLKQMNNFLIINLPLPIKIKSRFSQLTSRLGKGEIDKQGNFTTHYLAQHPQVAARIKALESASSSTKVSGKSKAGSGKSKASSSKPKASRGSLDGGSDSEEDDDLGIDEGDLVTEGTEDGSDGSEPDVYDEDGDDDGEEDNRSQIPRIPDGHCRMSLDEAKAVIGADTASGCPLLDKIRVLLDGAQLHFNFDSSGSGMWFSSTPGVKVCDRTKKTPLLSVKYDDGKWFHHPSENFKFAEYGGAWSICLKEASE